MTLKRSVLAKTRVRSNEHSRSGQTGAFRRTVLENGVRIVTETIPAVRSVSVGAWIAVGSRDEKSRECGISHFIEHMVFKGTARRRTHQVAQRMESVGGFLNAFTGKEYTCFYARGLDEHLGRAVDIVTDLILQPSFPERELVKEKDVVLEEIKMYEDNPEDRIFDTFESVVYRGHPLSRPIVGTPRSVATFSRDQLSEFVGRQYTTDRIVVSVAGNVEHDATVREVRKAFGERERYRHKRRRSVPKTYSADSVTETIPTQQAHLVLGTRGVSLYDEDRLPLIILNTLLGGGMSSRLNMHIRERYGFCYQVYSFMNMYSDGGDWGVYMGTDAGRIERAIKLVEKELDAVVQAPVGQRELSQAKSQVKGSIMLGLESMSTRMMRLGRHELVYKRYVSLDDVVEQIDAVTADDVQSVAAKMFRKQSFSKIIFAPGARNSA